jgi:hypothetical protein
LYDTSNKDKKEERNKKYRHSPSNKYDRQPHAGYKHDRQLAKGRYRTTTQGTSNKYDRHPHAGNKHDRLVTKGRYRTTTQGTSNKYDRQPHAGNKHDRQLAKERYRTTTPRDKQQIRQVASCKEQT